MMRLKAAIYSEEVKLYSRAKQTSGRIRANRGNISQPDREEKDVFRRKNTGVEDRDNASKKLPLKKDEKVLLSLKAKSEVYQDLIDGSISHIQNEDDCLINFQQKSTFEKKIWNQTSDEFVIVEDEFGREKRTLKSNLKDIPDRVPSLDIAPSERGQWAWSTGKGVNQWNEEREEPEEGGGKKDTRDNTDTTLKRLIQTKIELASQNVHTSRYEGGVSPVSPVSSTPYHHSHSHSSSSGSKGTTGGGTSIPVLVSESARVKSQWEKTLHGDAKLYVDKIHQETLLMRSSIHVGESSRIHGHSASNSSSYVEENLLSVSGMESINSLEKERDHRRELLRQKQENRKKQKLDA